jgi:hypothetical protein
VNEDEKKPNAEKKPETPKPEPEENLTKFIREAFPTGYCENI